MKWLVRSLWLAAWSFWLWLGFGLYRELPRDLGPVVSRFPMRENEGDYAFIHGTHEVFTEESKGNGKPVVIRLRNVVSDRVVRVIENGPITQESRSDYRLSKRHGILVAAERPAIEGRPMPSGQSVLDLHTGSWLDLPADAVDEPTFHDEKPWAVFSEFGGDDERGRIVVVDVRTGAALFRWDGRNRPGPPRKLADTPFFIGDSMIGLPTQKVLGPDDVYDPASAALEVWSISSAIAPLRVFPGLNVGNGPTSSANGRIAWHELDPNGWVDVFDVEAGKMVFSYPPNRKRWEGGISGAWPSPVISRDGTRVVGLIADKLWDVDSGRELWGGMRQDGNWFRIDAKVKSVDGDRFEIEEHWFYKHAPRNLWGETTYAVRSLSTGELLYRCWENTLPPHGDVTSDRALLFDRNAEVIRSLPPRVNYPLLALCQAILALPLILLWAILRWRRNRRVRLSSVQP